MKITTLGGLLFVLITLSVKADAPVHVLPDSDESAIALAQQSIVAMGGYSAWERTRYLKWEFFGGRKHMWDRYTGRVRIEAKTDESTTLWLMNVQTGKGRVFVDETEISDPEQRENLLKRGKGIWINDSYWLVMPFKLLDPGVRLKALGERDSEQGEPCHVLELTFENVGNTPENKYEVLISKDSSLVVEWTFYRNASDEEPGFTMPWKGWKSFGPIKLATSRGRELDWAIEVPETIENRWFAEPVR